MFGPLALVLCSWSTFDKDPDFDMWFRFEDGHCDDRPKGKEMKELGGKNSFMAAL